MRNLAGVLSFLFIGMSWFMALRLIKDRQKAVNRAERTAQEDICRRLKEFRDSVESERYRFVEAENLRRESLYHILQGTPWAVQDICQAAVKTVKTPFVMGGELALHGTQPVINFELPANDFVPRVEWEETNAGGFVVTDRPLTSVNRLFVETVTSVMIQVALRILEQAPTIEAVFINATDRSEEKIVTRVGIRVTREEIPQIVDHENVLRLTEVLGSIRLEVGYGLTPVPPLLPEWVDSAMDHEVSRSSLYTNLQH